MNISDFVGRGNPEDMDDDFEPLFKSSQENKASTTPQKQGTAPKKGLLSRNAFIIGVLLLSSSASFGLGLLAGQGGATAANAGGLLVGAAPTTPPSSAALAASVLDGSTLSTNSASSSIPEGGEVIGASNTHTYYLPWCPQASKISKADTVWFPTEQIAKSSGYKAGADCPGL